MKESVLQAKCLRYLEGLGLYGRKIISANRAGTPDVVACLEGRFVGFEFKISTGKQSELQKWNEQEIIRNGGHYFIIREFKDFREKVLLFLENPTKKEDCF